MIKAVIFDCFGVLVTNAATIAFEKMGGDLERQGEQLWDLYKAYDLGNITFEEEHTQIAELLGVSYDDWVRTMQEQTHYNEPLADYIRTLPLKKAMMSNIGQQSLAALNEALDLDTMMDELIISSQVGYIKPDRRIYEIGAEMLGVEPEECVFVDDSQMNTAGAEVVGMKTILYRNKSQLERDLAQMIGAQ